MSDYQESKRSSIFDKYDIPLDHYEFDYIRNCSDKKEVEKIVKVLRSIEGNHFPQLLETAEKKLGELDPNHRLLRKATKPLTKDMFRQEDFQAIQNELNDWASEFSKKDKDLKKSKTKAPPEDTVPPVRVSSKATEKMMEELEKGERIRSYEYDKWDKFDADAECLKMDIKEEKRNLQLPKKNSTFKDEIAAVEKLACTSAKCLSKVEKERISTSEKDLGNECYKLGEWQESISHYSKSIGTFPTAVVYNNRAAAYLKINFYDEAISDATFVVQMEPANFKALYRRAQAYEALGYFNDALKDVEAILREDPVHTVAEKMAKKLRTQKEKSKPKPKPTTKSYCDFSLPGPSGLTREDLKKCQSRPLIEEIEPGFKGNLKILEVESKKQEKVQRGFKMKESKSPQTFRTVEEMRSEGIDVWDLSS